MSIEKSKFLLIKAFDNILEIEKQKCSFVLPILCNKICKFP